MHYSIERPTAEGAAAILDAAMASFAENREMQLDLSRLSKACCEPQTFVSLVGAPLPAALEAE